MLGTGVFYTWYHRREDGCVCIWCLPVRDNIRQKTGGWGSQELAKLGKIESITILVTFHEFHFRLSSWFVISGEALSK